MAQPQQVVPPAKDKAVNGKLCPILLQRGVNGTWEVALGTCGQAHGCLLTSHSPSLQEHPLNTKCSGDEGSCPALLAPTMSEGRQWEAEEAVRVVVKMTGKED